MKVHKIKIVQEQARKVMQLADQVLNEALTAGDTMTTTGKNPASLRRASLDLTRALADMRK